MTEIPTTLVEPEFAIVMATYYRPNGSTKAYLTRALECILQQIHTKWHLFLIGDKYTNEAEFAECCALLPQDKITFHNHDNPEREYIKNKQKLWCIAGANAVNYGLNLARQRGFRFHVHLDDDDFWTPEHLAHLSSAYAQYPHCIFAFTKSTYMGTTLPRSHVTTVYPNNVLPAGGTLIHSSFSFRCDIISYNYFTTKNESDHIEPSDLLMLNQINHFLQLHPEYCSIYIPQLSCYHDVEGAAKK